MIKSEWKPQDEIRWALEPAEKVSVLACNGCAAQCGTGGAAGVKRLKPLLQEWGKELALVEVVEECCDQPLMSRVATRAAEALCASDALAVISCASGVKAALNCAPGFLVVPVLDTLGGGVATTQENRITDSLCKGCGQCVIACTGGICPVSTCPGKRKYGACRTASGDFSKCMVDVKRDCVWQEIARRGDLDALRDLQARHRTDREMAQCGQASMSEG